MKLLVGTVALQFGFSRHPDGSGFRESPCNVHLLTLAWWLKTFIIHACDILVNMHYRNNWWDNNQILTNTTETRVTRPPPSFGLLALQQERAHCLSLIIVCKWGLNYNLFFYGSQEEASETQWEYEDEDLTMEGWCFRTLIFSEILICSTYYCYYLCSVLFWTLLTVTVFYASNYEKQSTNYLCVSL